MNVAGGPIGIIMETRHSLSGFPGCSTNGCLFMPLCQGPAQPPPCARNIIFHLKLENLVPAAMFKYFCGLTAHHMHSIFLKIVLSVMTVICGGMCPAIRQHHGACYTRCMAYLRRPVPSFNFNFFLYVGTVGLDCFDTQVQFFRDLACFAPLADNQKNSEFPVTQKTY